MRYYPLYNHPAFTAAQRVWEFCGHSVISPAEYDRENGRNPYDLPYNHDWSKHWDSSPLADCYLWDVEAILRKATCIALLPGWERSVGSRGEVAVAQVAGLPFFDAFSMRKLHIEAVFDVEHYSL